MTGHPLTPPPGNARPALLLPAIVLGMVLAGCDPVDRRVSFDPAADFAAYRTYVWHLPITTDEAAVDPVYNPVVTQRIRDAVDRALAARGFRQATPADLSISVAAGSARGESLHYLPDGPPRPGRLTPGFGFGSGYGFGSGSGYGYGMFWTPVVVPYTTGTIAIDVFDTATGRPVWHGAAEKLIDPDDTSVESIEAIVGKILADFPPGRATGTRAPATPPPPPPPPPPPAAPIP